MVHQQMMLGSSIIEWSKSSENVDALSRRQKNEFGLSCCHFPARLYRTLLYYKPLYYYNSLGQCEHKYIQLRSLSYELCFVVCLLFSFVFVVVLYFFSPYCNWSTIAVVIMAMNVQG